MSHRIDLNHETGALAAYKAAVRRHLGAHAADEQILADWIRGEREHRYLPQPRPPLAMGAVRFRLRCEGFEFVEDRRFEDLGDLATSFGSFVIQAQETHPGASGSDLVRLFLLTSLLTFRAHLHPTRVVEALIWLARQQKGEQHVNELLLTGQQEIVWEAIAMDESATFWWLDIAPPEEVPATPDRT